MGRYLDCLQPKPSHRSGRGLPQAMAAGRPVPACSWGRGWGRQGKKAKRHSPNLGEGGGRKARPATANKSNQARGRGKEISPNHPCQCPCFLVEEKVRKKGGTGRERRRGGGERAAAAVWHGTLLAKKLPRNECLPGEMFLRSPCLFIVFLPSHMNRKEVQPVSLPHPWETGSVHPVCSKRRL